ncbi:bifunctional 2-polyprenyl-6-hydroxyphenol methylase/3-demethylubiquinol 3-O-methyltransferase UbiG [Mycobacterium sp. 1165178.9]|uniref:class I SAM-dependent methyltransferase n=1 Tax=Mycobacterium sp. 1165178.9 TaxID=1834070 RepID=UPI000AD8A362|nr:methyltransferase domain-containing protein [Mycobacterium sp. 1165178.9]
MKQTNGNYLFRTDMFGADAERERARLAGNEALWDPGSQSIFAELGLGPGWHCLEVGAGGGSLVEWMADRGAAVTAVDIDTRFIEHLASDNVDVHCLDIRTDALPPGEFDLVHARLVLQHLRDREQILNQLATTLRPGGSIVVEEFDWTYFGWETMNPALNATTRAVLDYAEQTGIALNFGRRILHALHQAGLVVVGGQGSVQIIDSACPGFDFFELTIRSMLQPVVEVGAVCELDADAAIARLDRKDLRLHTPMMVTGIGQRR